MKQILRYSLVALLAMIVGNVYADTEVTFTLNDQDAITALGITLPEAGKGTKVEEMSKDGVKIVATTAEGKTDTRIYQGSGGNAGKYDFRIYQGGTLTFTAGANVVKKIVFTGNNLNRLSGDGYDTDTWAGSASSVTLTATGTATIYTITVTFGEAAAVTVAAPTISGTTPFVGSTEVTITNNEDGAKVYYTTNGDAPTASSTEYSAPFTITETTTVKAIAVKGGTSSSVTSKTFTAVPSVANVAALNALKNNDVFAFAGEALVVYVSGKYAYIKDDTGSSLVYDSGSSKLANLAVGKKIAANWTGKVSIYNNLFEAVPDAVLNVTEAAAVTVTYPTAEITDVKADNMNQVVVLKDVIYTAPDGKSFSITKDGIDIIVPGYNQFGLEIAAPEDGKTYDITGVISVYKENVQFQPISIAEAAPVTTDTWTIAGTKPLVDQEWKPEDTSADMTSTDGVNFTYVKENIVLEKGTDYLFKVAKNHAWEEAYPSSNYVLKVDETAKYKVTITFNATTHEVGCTAEKTGEAGPVTHTYGVVGTLVGSWDNDVQMTKDDDGLYKAVINDVAKGNYKFKVRADGAWSIAYPQNDYELTVDQDGSTVTVTFNEETKEVNATVSAGTGINTAKVVELNGAVYNVAGQMVTSGYKGLVIKNGKKMIQK